MEYKQAYKQTMETRLSQIGAKIDQLQAKVQQAGVETKAKFQQQIENLKAKRDAVNQKLEQFNASGESALESLKIGLQKAWDDLSSAVEEASQKFTEETKT